MKLVFLISLLIISSTSIAKVVSLTLGESEGSINIPKAWRVEENFMGMRYTLFGPMISTHRPVISVSHNGVPLTIIDLNKKMSEIQDNYKRGKVKWLNKRSAKLISFTRRPRGMMTKYRLGQSEVIEVTDYYQCDKKIMHVKLLLSSEAAVSYESSLKVFESFRCKR